MKQRALAILPAAVLAASLAFSCMPRQVPPPAQATFGALIPITGERASTGESVMAAIELAARDVNTHLGDIRSWLRISVYIDNTRSEPQVALEATRIFARRGGKMIIGPDTDGELLAVKEFVDKNGLLTLSYGSTAPSLAVADDNVFRMLPDDGYQARAIAGRMVQDKVRAILPFWRGDPWGDELADAVKAKFEALGGSALEGIRYAPSTADFSQGISALSIRVSQAVAQHGPSGVGVYLASSEEAATILREASKRSNLSSVRWYGSDRTVRDDRVTGDSNAAAFAASTNFIVPTANLGGDNEKLTRVRKLIEDKIKRPPDEDAYPAYDAVWIVTLTHLSTGPTTDAGLLKKALIESASMYYGITGRTTFNRAGDRRPASYDLWTVVRDGAAYRWKQTGTQKVGTE